MPTHAEIRTLPYRPDQLFDLVADIEKYPEFLPWCVGCRVTSRDGDVIWGDVVVGFKLFRETFTSKVTLERPDRIHVAYIDGPFHYLDNHWVFMPTDDGRATTIDFYVDFEFRSRALQLVARAAFTEAVKRMVRAFELRARDVYGVTPALDATPVPAGD